MMKENKRDLRQLLELDSKYLPPDTLYAVLSTKEPVKRRTRLIMIVILSRSVFNLYYCSTVLVLLSSFFVSLVKKTCDIFKTVRHVQAQGEKLSSLRQVY